MSAPAGDGTLLFGSLEDSPFMRKQLASQEEGVAELRERSTKLTKAARKYRDSLADAADAQRAFASALDSFGLGRRSASDEASTSAVGLLSGTLRELAGFTEALRTQTDSVLVDQLSALERGPLEDVKTARKAYDKALTAYDQLRGRHLALGQGSRAEAQAAAATAAAESKSAFDAARVALAASLQRVHTLRRCAYVEAATTAAAAHAAFFHDGSEAASALDGRVQGLRTAAAAERAAVVLDRSSFQRLAAMLNGPSRTSSGRMVLEDDACGAPAASGNDLQPGGTPDRPRSAGQRMVGGCFVPNSPVGPGDSVHGGRLSDCDPPPSSKAESFGAIVVSDRARRCAAKMASAAAAGTVSVLKQGYLLKQSHSLYATWKRRFFVLDTRGDLRYFRDEETGVLDRLGGKQARQARFSAPAIRDSAAAAATVSLLTSTIKRDGSDGASSLRFCFRLVSPSKEYTLQAESEEEQAEWMETIAGTIAVLLSHGPVALRPLAVPAVPLADSPAQPRSPVILFDEDGDASPFGSSLHGTTAEARRGWDEELFDALGAAADASTPPRSVAGRSPEALLRRCPGNDRCADCGAAAPEWASLNITVLLCLRCSGAHRALGSHLSKVRSLALDTRAWTPAVLALMRKGGNAAVNEVLEESSAAASMRPRPDSSGDAAVSAFVRSKYENRTWLASVAAAQSGLALERAVGSGDVRAALCALLAGASADAVVTPQPFAFDEDALAGAASLPVTTARSGDGSSPTAHQMLGSRGSLLHCAAAAGDMVMLELLLLNGARMDVVDSSGRSPLHAACGALAGAGSGAAECVRRLLQAGADPSARDGAGVTPQSLAAGRDFALDAEIAACLAAAAVRVQSSPMKSDSGSSWMGHRRIGSRDGLRAMLSTSATAPPPPSPPPPARSAADIAAAAALSSLSVSLAAGVPARR